MQEEAFGGGQGRAAQEDGVDGRRVVALTWWLGEAPGPIALSLPLSLSWWRSCRRDKELRGPGCREAVAVGVGRAREEARKGFVPLGALLTVTWM